MIDNIKPLFIEIRQAMPADVREWARMRHAFWPTADAATHEKELREMIASPGFVGFIALQGGTPAGFAEIFVRPFANGCDTTPVPFLEGIWVAPDLRRKGIARKLVAACEDWARSRRFRELGSDAELSNVASHQSHAAWGFEEMERVVHFRKRLD